MMNPSADQEFKMTPMLRYECPAEVNVSPEVQKKLEREGEIATMTGRILHNDGSIKIVTAGGGREEKEAQFRRIIGLNPVPSIFQLANKKRNRYSAVQAGVKVEGIMIVPPKALRKATMDEDAPFDITVSKSGPMVTTTCAGTSMFDEAAEYQRYMTAPKPSLVRSSNEAIFGSAGSLNPAFNNNGDTTSSDDDNNITMRTFTVNAPANVLNQANFASGSKNNAASH